MRVSKIRFTQVCWVQCCARDCEAWIEGVTVEIEMSSFIETMTRFKPIFVGIDDMTRLMRVDANTLLVVCPKHFAEWSGQAPTETP